MIKKDYNINNINIFLSSLLQIEKVDFYEDKYFWKYFDVLSKYLPLKIEVNNNYSDRFQIVSKCRTLKFYKMMKFKDLKYGVLFTFARSLEDIFTMSNITAIQNNINLEYSQLNEFVNEIKKINDLQKLELCLSR